MKIFKIIMLLFITGMFVSCSSLGSLTAEDAMKVVQKSYKLYDYSSLNSVLATKSKNKIRKMIYNFSKMEIVQLKSVASKFDYPVAKLKNLKIEDYLHLYMKVERKKNSIRSSILLNVIGVDYQDDVAIIRVENGMHFEFTKEGPYWKFVLP